MKKYMLKDILSFQYWDYVLECLSCYMEFIVL